MARRAFQITGKNRIVLSPFFPDYLFFFFFAIFSVAKFAIMVARQNNPYYSFNF